MRLAALIVAVAAAAQAPVGEIVRIDVIATDNRGRPVENLKAADFTLREDGSTQAIEDVRLVKVQDTARSDGPAVIPISSAADERAEAARESARVVGMYL